MLEGLSQDIPSSFNWPEDNHEEDRIAVLDHLSISENSLLRRRRLEDVDYWRKRAGWFDDDEAMKEYNSGVYDTYYGLDDDKTRTGGSRKKAANSKLAKNALIVLAVIVALGLSFLMARVISRRLDGGKEKKKKSSSERSRSRSRSRSKSRSRKEKERGGTASDYDLMDDDKDERASRKSSRSKSKSRRSRSRSRTRTSSRSKSRKESTADPVLV